MEERRVVERMKAAHSFEPDYAVPPGATLLDTIEALGMSQRDLATRAGLAAKTINLIVKGKERISHKTSVVLERVTGVPARMWNNLEANYREQVARLEDRKQLEARVAWLSRTGIPVRELIKRGVLSPAKDKVKLLQAVLQFFGVRNPQAWERTWAKPENAYRKSSRFTLELGPTAAWLRLGELRAQEIETAPYDRAAFRAALDEIRKLTIKPPDVFEPRMLELCGAAGVAVALVPPINGCPAYGAARWVTSGKAVIQLSLRGKYEDQLWFTFFHEAAHILNDPKRAIFLDNGKAEHDCEKAANRFAADLLIPPDAAALLGTLRGYPAVKDFARSIGIAPGIVVGRMQKDGWVEYSHYNRLKRKFDWKHE